MNTFKIVEDILAEPKTVFAVLCDVERWPNWTPTMTQVRRLEGGTFGLGSRAEVQQPKLKPGVWTVSEFVPERNFTWTTGAPGVRMIAAHEVEASRSGCRVTLSIDVQGWLRLMIVLRYGRLINEYVTTEAKSLKSHSEALTRGQKQAPGYRAAIAP
jgi:hypothetical protein